MSHTLILNLPAVSCIQALFLDFNHGKVHLDDLVNCGKNLSTVVDSLVSQHIDRTLRQCCHQWQEVESLAKERLGRFEDVKQQWEAYEGEFTGCKAWVEAKEIEVNDLLRNSVQDPRHQLKQSQVNLYLCLILLDYSTALQSTRYERETNNSLLRFWAKIQTYDHICRR